jgi:hypothetical protein
MWHTRVWRTARAASVTLSFVFLFAIVAFAQDAGQATPDKRQNAPGQRLCRARALAAIREGLSVLLSGAGAQA